MLRWLRRLFCRHEWEVTEHASMFWSWHEARCKKCGKVYK